MGLHEVILDSRIEGWDGLEENDDYPEGITPEKLSEISKSFGDKAIFLFVPAYLVPESTTAKRIADSNQNLESRYVVYREFRRGLGHDSSYG